MVSVHKAHTIVRVSKACESACPLPQPSTLTLSPCAPKAASSAHLQLVSAAAPLKASRPAYQSLVNAPPLHHTALHLSTCPS